MPTDVSFAGRVFPPGIVPDRAVRPDVAELLPVRFRTF